MPWYAECVMKPLLAEEFLDGQFLLNTHTRAHTHLLAILVNEVVGFLQVVVDGSL